MAARLICASAELADGGAGVRFTTAAGAAAFVVRFQGVVRGYLNACAHQAVELDWLPGQFFDDAKVYLICATHGALYDPASGACVGGRCGGKGLAPLAVMEQDGSVFLREGEGKMGP